MGTKSGKDGKVMVGTTTLASITHWELATTARNFAYASSATQGSRKRVPGVKDVSGSISFKLNFDAAITSTFDEGDEVSLLLYLDNSRHYTVPAIIDSVDLDEVNIDEGTPIGGTARFSGTGPVTKPTY